MDLQTVLSFVLIASLLVMSPGPNGVLIAKTVPTSGRSAGFANVAGFPQFMMIGENASQSAFLLVLSIRY